MSKTILHIDSSPMGDHSVSRKLTAKIVAELQNSHPDATLIRYDLGTKPLPHVDGLTIGGFFTSADQHNEVLATAVKASDQAVAELLAADYIVIGAPMHNFGIPSTLKAWIDHVVRLGKTFHYTATGAQGLVPSGKKVIIVSSRGGIYSEGPMKVFDHQEAYLRDALGFLGLTDVSFVRAEGVSMGSESLAKALSTADAHITETLKTLA